MKVLESPAKLAVQPSLVLAALALGCWVLGLRTVDPAELGGLGLVTALPPTVLLAYPLLVAAMAVELRRPSTWRLTVLTSLGVVLVYGLQPAVQQHARLPVAWLHAGFANHIADHGDVVHSFDARFSWPGFFSFVAFLVRAGGADDASAFLRWAPVLLAGLAVLGVRALALVVLGDGTAAWLAPWVFLFGNWTEQDYFSPQGLTFPLLLAALAIALRYLTRPVLSGPFEPVGAPWERFFAHGIVLLIAAALAPSHQLTPFMLAGFLLVLVVFRRLWPMWLPVLAFLLAVAWFSLGAKEFWQGQLEMITGTLGDVSASVQHGFRERIIGDQGHRLILVLRVGITGLVAVMAAVGLWRSRERGWALAALAAAPFGLAVLQPYGGEIFMRGYLFALPFLAVGAALALRQHWSAWVLLVLLGLGTVVARGGNDAYVSFGSADVAAVDEAYRRVQPGGRIEALTLNLPLSRLRVADVAQGAVDQRCPRVAELAACVRAAPPEYLVITGAQEAYGRISLGLPDDWASSIARDLVSGGRYRVVFDEEGSQVLERTEGGR